MREHIIPPTPLSRLIKRMGAERVSDDATIALSKALEEYGAKISAKAVLLAKHAGRKTIREADITLAVQLLTENKKVYNP